MNLKRHTIAEESFLVDALNASSHFYPNKRKALHFGPDARVWFEPPCTEPYAGWCETRELITLGTPIEQLLILSGLPGLGFSK